MSAFIRRCVVCGAANAGLLPYPAGMQDGVCGQLACLHTVQLQSHAQRSAATQRRMDSVRAVVGGTDPIVLLPSNRRRTTRLPAHRRADFAAHLEAHLDASSDAAGAITAGDETPHELEALSPRETLAVSQGCATCRGFCCQSGGTTAWLTTETLRRVRRNSSFDTAALRAAYLRDLPHRSYHRSCVYHTARGCALTPALRSDTCHQYLCEGASTLVALVRAGADVAHAAATEGSQIARVGRVALPEQAAVAPNPAR